MTFRIGREIDEALGEVGILGGKRRFDFSGGAGSVKCLRQRVIGDLGRIVGDQ